MTCPVIEVAALDAEAFYEDYVSSSQPVIVRDERLRGLRSLWTDDYLARIAGDQVHQEVRVADNSSDFPLTKVAGERTAPHTVAHFLAEYASPKRATNLYATNLVIEKLQYDLQRPPFTALLDHGCASAWCAGLWLGAGNQRSALHRDFAENLHLVVQGRKRFLIFAPNESIALYPRPEPANRLGHATSMPAGARTCNDDGGGCPAPFARFGAARQRALDCTVQEGEMLFLPSAWWHEVESHAVEGRSLSLNWWFKAEWPRKTLHAVSAEVEAPGGHLAPTQRAPAYRQLGVELAQRGRAHDAAPLLRRALDLEPGDDVANTALEMLRARFGVHALRTELR